MLVILGAIGLLVLFGFIGLMQIDLPPKRSPEERGVTYDANIF